MSGDISKTESESRLDRLSHGRREAGAYDPQKYSAVIRKIRIALPVFAALIIAVILVWDSLDSRDIPAVREDTDSLKTVGENELINPRFESRDDKQQPYTITADRAVQSKDNENQVMLEKPLADILLNDGAWIALKANRGVFYQDTQELLLEEQVELFHDLGYRLKTQALHIDVGKQTAWSDKTVEARGPEGALDAAGLKVDSQAGHLVFTGPARLVLTRVSGGFALEGMN